MHIENKTLVFACKRATHKEKPYEKESQEEESYGEQESHKEEVAYWKESGELYTLKIAYSGKDYYM